MHFEKKINLILGLWWLNHQLFKLPRQFNWMSYNRARGITECANFKKRVLLKKGIYRSKDKMVPEILSLRQLEVFWVYDDFYSGCYNGLKWGFLIHNIVICRMDMRVFFCWLWSIYPLSYFFEVKLEYSFRVAIRKKRKIWT